MRLSRTGGWILSTESFHVGAWDALALALSGQSGGQPLIIRARTWKHYLGHFARIKGAQSYREFINIGFRLGVERALESIATILLY